MTTPGPKSLRNSRIKVSILSGNLIQSGGIALGCALLWWSSFPSAALVRAVSMIGGYLLIYFSSHSLAHFLVGRSARIRFTHYSIGGTSHPSSLPKLLRPLFENLPFFAVHADPQSLRSASQPARSLMFASGIVSTALFSSIASVYTYRAEVPGSSILLIFNAIWQVSSLIAEARPGGDLGKAAAAMRT